MVDIFWPMNTLEPQNVSIDLNPRSLSTKASTSGFTQVVASDAGLWKCSFEEIPVHTRNQVNCWRAIAAQAEGRLGNIIIPFPTPWLYQPSYNGTYFTKISHSDGTFFSDGSGYLSSDNVIKLKNALAVNATSATVTIEQAPSEIEPGQHFSINDKLYRLKTVSYTTSAEADITFTPTLREAATAQTVLEFDRPTCTMRLINDKAMDLPLQIGRHSFPTINLIEAF